MIATELDYSRMMQACGLAGQNGEKRTINARISHFLNQTLAETMTEFGEKLETTSSNIANLGLLHYKEQEESQAAWQLANIPPPLTNWNFLTHIDPEKTGVLCGKSGEEPTLLTDESVHPLFDMKAFENTGAFNLWVSLSWWRTAICSIWAGKIVHGLLLKLRKHPHLYLPAGETVFTIENSDYEIRESEPIGSILSLPGVRTKEASDFHNLYEQAHFGSRDCEYRAAAALKKWLRSASIETFRSNGLSLDEAHHLFLAATQCEPRIDMELLWNQKAQAYQCICFVKNNDQYGYADKKKTSGISVDILLSFFGDAPGQVREDLFRLVLRAASVKARELLSKGLHRDLN